MKKDIKDYIHLYMGCECFEIIGTKRMNKVLTVTPEIIRYALTGTSIYKLSVRKLSSMTEEEAGHLGYHSISQNGGRMYDAQSFQYLLSKGFWLFGDDWFDEGLILDKDTVK